MFQRILNWLRNLFTRQAAPPVEQQQQPKPVTPPASTPVTPAAPSGQKITGIDVFHGDTVDFSKLDRNQVKFFFAKATQGAHHIDKSFAAYRNMCHQLGIPFGAYHFLDDTASGTEQAQNFCTMVGDMRHGELWPTLDWESGSKVTDQNVIQDFFRYARSKLGTDFMLYMGESFCREQNLPQSYSNYPLWIAHYGVKEPHVPQPWKSWTFFQYAEDAVIPGVGKGDISYFNGSEQELKRFIK